jgi:hypothetical protein
MVEFGKAVSETYFLIFFKNRENTFPKPHQPYAKIKNILSFVLFISEEWIGFGNRISIFLKKIRNSVSETALPKRQFDQVTHYPLPITHYSLLITHYFYTALRTYSLLFF